MARNEQWSKQADAAAMAAQGAAPSEGQDLPRRAGGPLSAEPEVQGARRSASVILLRDGEPGMQLLLMRRAERAGDTRSGIWVFPGGVLDPGDIALAAQACGAGDEPDDAQANAQLGLAQGGRDYWAAALRECFEEVGLLFAQGPASAIAVVRAQRAALPDAAALGAALASHGLRLDLAALTYCAHWLTPPGMAQRFDTRFFIARAPEGQQPEVDGGEALALAWFTPAQALAPEAALKLLPVTRRMLQDLAAYETVSAALAAAHEARSRVVRQMPRLGRDARGTRPVLPDEPAYAELGRADPTGRGDVPCDLQPLRVVALSPLVRRITCANGSLMTGPGTNSYLIGPPGGGELAVLDPGPDDAHTEAHLQALLAAAGAARISRILVSHTHRDHSPAALRLQALTGAELIGCQPQHPEWQDLSFVPDTTPTDGWRLPLGPGCTLQALATPGHASNHICWWLEEEALLFTGDHVMQGSTVVINPPDGDMAAYLASLRRLMGLPLQWLAPGHGFLIGEPRQALERLVAHRLAREAKVLAALRAASQAQGSVALEALLPAVYGDVPAARHEVAARSLLAHLLHLAEQGLAEPLGPAGWRQVVLPA